MTGGYSRLLRTVTNCDKSLSSDDHDTSVQMINHPENGLCSVVRSLESVKMQLQRPLDPRVTDWIHALLSCPCGRE
jgi:hypothetical protein